MDQLTFSQITGDTTEIGIPSEAITDISKLAAGDKVLSIYSSNAKALYFFRVKSSVFHIKIKIYPLTPEIVAKIMGRIAQFASRVVYSTGLCLVGDKCFWEGFVQKDELTQEIDKIRDFLMDVEEVKDVEVAVVSD